MSILKKGRNLSFVAVYLNPTVEDYLRNNFKGFLYSYKSEDTVDSIREEVNILPETKIEIDGYLLETNKDKSFICLSPLKGTSLFPNENGEEDVTAVLFGFGK